jgi:23S rRNA (cytidine1920-2'-O)/16S rRNA (cytidine1409-2'-O)-methyltransferase
MVKIRLDIAMTERGLAETRSLAQKLVMAGQVRVDGQVAAKASEKVLPTTNISVDQPPRFVSRGGEKLAAAMEAFGLVDLHSMVCVDVGASTGGFTDCMLQAGAKKVFSIDVGYGDFHWKLRNDPRVELRERTNARFVKGFSEKIDLVVVDASFISLKVLLPVIKEWFIEEKGKVIALIKPQFEAGRTEVSRGDGVIRDVGLHRQIVTDVLGFAEKHGFRTDGIIYSPLTGPKGNKEFLAILSTQVEVESNLSELVEKVFVNMEMD